MGARLTRLSNQAFAVGGTGGNKLLRFPGRLMPPQRPPRGRARVSNGLLASESSWAAIRLVAVLFDPETNLIFDRKPARGCARKL